MAIDQLLPLTISAKPVGVWAGLQPWIPRGEQSGLQDAHRSDGKRFIVRANEMLSAFLELESAIRACGEFNMHRESFR
jgi:hypothetical protein